MKSTNKLIDNCLSNNIDNIEKGISDIVQGVTEVIKDSAKKVFKIKRKHFKKDKGRKHRRRHKVDWFDVELDQLKSQLNKIAKNVHKYLKDPSVRKQFMDKKKLFKRAVRQQRKAFFEDPYDRIALMEKEKPKEFWTMVSKLQESKKNNTLDSIEPEVWFSWFQTLNKCNQVDYETAFCKGVEGIVRNMDDFTKKTNQIMDGEISCQEVINATKKLKNNKATGNDAICNEMLKSVACTDFISVITKVFNVILVHSHFPALWKLESRLHLPYLQRG